MPFNKRFLIFMYQYHFLNFILLPLYNIAERLAWTERPAMSLLGSGHPASMRGATATTPNYGKEEPLPREYLTFDPETQGLRLLERGCSQNEA